jgi:hypothetical protein
MTYVKGVLLKEPPLRNKAMTPAEIGPNPLWQNHSIRGFISRTITKKMGLAVVSAKNEAGERTYRIA